MINTIKCKAKPRFSKAWERACTKHFWIHAYGPGHTLHTVYFGLVWFEGHTLYAIVAGVLCTVCLLAPLFSDGEVV